jgi:hypothetical protein
MDTLQDSFEVDETINETPRPETPTGPTPTVVRMPVPVRRHRIISTARISHATPKGRAEFAAAHLAGELSVKPNKAAVYRQFQTYAKPVSEALAVLRGNNHSVAESLLVAEWRRASPAVREIFVGENAVALVRANPDAMLTALDHATAP